MRARGFSPCASPNSRVADQDRGGAVDDAGGVAGVVDVVDPLQMRVFQDRHRVEAGHHLAHVLEGGLQRAERLHVGAGAHVFVAVEDRQAVAVADRRSPISRSGPRPRPVAARRWLSTASASHVVAGEAELGGDDVGARCPAARSRSSSQATDRRRSRRRPSPWRPGSSSRRRRRYRPARRRRATWLAARFTASRPRGAEAVDREAGDRLVEIGEPAPPSGRGSRPARRPG